jgi:hypothetical protein
VLLLPVLPLVPPPDAAPAPDFLKCASHSSREICPSPFLSTDEKLGVWPLAPLEAPAFGALEASAFGALEAPPDALPSDDLPAALLSDDLPAALLSDDLPAALPEDAPAELSEGLLSVALGLDELGLCAAATPASAKSAAAVAVPTTFNNMGKFLLGELGRTAAANNAMSMPADSQHVISFTVGRVQIETCNRCKRAYGLPRNRRLEYQRRGLRRNAACIARVFTKEKPWKESRSRSKSKLRSMPSTTSGRSSRSSRASWRG